MTSVGDDRGYVAAFTAAVAVAMIALVAMVHDGGRWIRAQSNTFGIASAAARAGAQQIDQAAALQGQLQLDVGAAEEAALRYLTSRGFAGTVVVDELEVTVTADAALDLQLLPAGSVTVSETATARATQERPSI